MLEEIDRIGEEGGISLSLGGGWVRSIILSFVFPGLEEEEEDDEVVVDLISFLQVPTLLLLFPITLLLEVKVGVVDGGDGDGGEIRGGCVEEVVWEGR